MICAARCYAAAGNCSPSYSWRTTCTCSSRRLAPILRGACSNSSRRMPSGTDDAIVESGTCSRDGTGPNSSRMRATIGPSAGISTSIRSVLGSSSARTHGGGRAIPRYAKPSHRLPWVALEALLSAWRGEHGGTDSARAYRRFVEAGLRSPPPSPFREAFGGWVLGSERFFARLRELAGPVLSDPPLPGARQLAARDPEAILEAVCDHFGLVRSALARRGDPHIARAAAAWHCRQHCEIALHELAPMLGLSRADSVPNLTRRIDAGLRSHPRLADDLKEIMARIGRETKNKVCCSENPPRADPCGRAKAPGLSPRRL